MAAHQLDCNVSIVYCILQAACRFKLPAIRQAAVRWLRQNDRTPTGDLLIRLKLSELEESCSKRDDWSKDVGRIVDLYDFIAPKDPEQTSYSSPWFYFRVLIIVAAAVQGYDDDVCVEACKNLLLKMPTTEPGTEDFAKKQKYVEKLTKELVSYNGTTDQMALKSKFPLIYQYLRHKPADYLLKFLAKFAATLEPDFCFLEAAAEHIRSDGAIELPEESQRLGLAFLLEQFKDIEKSLERSKTAENPAEMPSDGHVLPDDAIRNSREGGSPSRSQPSPSEQRKSRPLLAKQVESEALTGTRAKSNRKDLSTRTKPSVRNEDRHSDGNPISRKQTKKNSSENLNQFQKRRRSVHRAVEKIPDARERAHETARRIQEALERGTYERWSDIEDEASRSPSPLPMRALHSTPRSQTPVPSQHYRKPSSAVSSHNEQWQVRRRSVGQWQEYEMEELRAGVAQFGVGQWSQILRNGRFLPGRTSVDLKDKYRNMVKRNLIR